MTAATKRAQRTHEARQDWPGCEAEDFLCGVVVDHLDGVVGEMEIEKAESRRDPIEPNWSLSS